MRELAERQIDALPVNVVPVVADELDGPAPDVAADQVLQDKRRHRALTVGGVLGRPAFRPDAGLGAPGALNAADHAAPLTSSMINNPPFVRPQCFHPA